MDRSTMTVIWLILLCIVSVGYATVQYDASGSAVVEDILNSDKMIGGETDDRDCLDSAGYEWSSEVGACIRTWELDNNQLDAAKIAVEYMGLADDLTIVNVEIANCPGCFIVHMQDTEERITVTLFDWEVADYTTIPL